MVSKNNRLLKNLNHNDLHQHFALRKLNIGVASVLIGLGLTCGIATTDAHAAVTNEQNDPQQVRQTTPVATQGAATTLTANVENEGLTTDTQETSNQQETVYHAQPVTLTLGQNNVTSPSVDDVLKPQELHDLGVNDPNNASFYWSDNNNMPSAPGTYHNVPGMLTTESKEWQITFPTVNIALKALPLQTTVGEVPELTISSILPASVYQTAVSDMSDPRTKVEWVDQPDVSQATITPVKGSVKITYPNPDGQTPHILTLPVEVTVRAGQAKGANQVRNRINYIDEATHQIVYSFSTVGDKNSSAYDQGDSTQQHPESYQIDNAPQLLGYQVDSANPDNSSSANLNTFTDHDQTFNLFVKGDSTTARLIGSEFSNPEMTRSFDFEHGAPDAQNFVANFPQLPAGTTAKWRVKPTYDFTKQDGAYVNTEITNSDTNMPVIEVDIPGQQPQLLKFTPENSYVLSLPEENQGQPVFKRVELTVGDTFNGNASPKVYLSNYDDMLSHAQTSGMTKEEFDNGIYWLIQPNTNQAGYTIAVAEQNGQALPLVVKVNPRVNNKNITETVKYIDNHGKVLHDAFTKTIKVIGEETVAGAPINYQNTHFDKVDSPVIDGYQTKQASIPAQDANNDLNFTVTYTPNQQIIDYKVVDDTTNQVLSGNDPLTLVTGKSDEEVPADTQQKLQRVIQQYLDEGYEQVGTIQVPGHFDHNDKDNQLITVHLKHGLLTVDQKHPGKPGEKINPHDPRTDAPVYPADSADLTKTVTRTVKLTVGNEQPRTIATQPVVFSGAGTLDRVTGQWQQPIQWTHQSGEMTAVQIPVANGYHLVSIDRDGDGQQVKAVTVQPTDKSYTVNVVEAKEPTAQVIYVDQDNGNTEIPGTGSGVLTGTAGQTIDYQTATTLAQLKQQDYVLVTNGFDPNGTAPKYDVDNTATQTYTVTLKHAKTTKDLQKTVTRTINLHLPGGQTEPTKQVAHPKRTATVDEVTGKVTYGDWSTDEWASYQTPAITGYTPTRDQVAQVTVDGDTRDQTIDISYTADAQEIDYQVIDDVTGKVISGDQSVRLITGSSDQVVPAEAQQDLDQVVKNYQDHGYVLVGGNQVPAQFDHVDNDNQLITIHVKHAQTVVTPDQPKTPADVLPDNPSENYPTGVGQDDLNKTITRTINLHLPDGSIKTIHQDAHLTRTATVDEVTKQVTYGPWSTADWPEYDVPTISGYTASQSTIPLTEVISTTSPVTVDVYYHALPQTDNGEHNGTNHTNQPGQTTVNDGQPATTAHRQQLPQTGNHDSQAALALGFSALLGMMGLLGSQHKQDED